MPQHQQAQPERRNDTSRLLSVLAAITIALSLAYIGYRLATRPNIDNPMAGRQTPVLLIDINTATEAELAALPRIGPALAKRISEDRSVSGPYRSLDDIDRVPGIGPRTIEAIRPYAVAR